MRVDALGANLPAASSSVARSRTRRRARSRSASSPPSTAAARSGIRLRFEGGRVVDASAESNEEYLIETLDTDEGARRIGELGIGCNPGITRYMKNTLFDEKMDGTVHLALGNSYTDLGGVN